MKYLSILFFLLISCSTMAQLKPTDLDKSPADISYFPQNYPILKMNGKMTAAPAIRLIYSRPQKAGREIFGGIVGYGQVWRLGANEATEIEFFKNAKINGKTILKGRYSLYAICNENTWTVIINSERDIWGLSYNPKKDIMRVDVPVQKTADIIEAFTMYFEEIKGGANLNIQWDNTRVSLPIIF